MLKLDAEIDQTLSCLKCLAGQSGHWYNNGGHLLSVILLPYLIYSQLQRKVNDTVLQLWNTCAYYCIVSQEERPESETAGARVRYDNN